MRSRLLVVALVVATAIGGATFAHALGTPLQGAARASATAQRIDPPPPPPPGVETVVVDLVNSERGARGLSAVQWDARAGSAAAAHSADMALRDQMTHTGSDGSNGGDRLTRAGYRWTAWGEDVAAGYRQPADVVQGWMNSPSHREQILGNYEHAGVGIAVAEDGTMYWTLDLARD